jgi:ubiquinone/menaquinone biosynthesis C-methylase UbiE
MKKFFPSDKMRWNIYPKILKKVHLKINENILDAGCGQGFLSKYLPKHKKLYGIDFNYKSVEKASHANYFEVKKGDVSQIPYENKKFDKTICIEVFQYLKEPLKAFEELMRVTKKEIIICVPNYNAIGIRSILFKKWRKPFFETINKTYFPTNKEFLEKFAKDNVLKFEVKYISCRGGAIRNLFGNMLSSEVIGIFKLK